MVPAVAVVVAFLAGIVVSHLGVVAKVESKLIDFKNEILAEFKKLKV